MSECPSSPLSFLSHQVIYRDVRVLFKARKNRDGWFGSNQLLTQVDKVVDIFEGLTKGNAQGLFLFDNAPSHQKCTLDVISAWHMPKSAFLFLSPLTHLTQRLITPPRRSKGKLDTLRRWDTHAQWQTSNW